MIEPFNYTFYLRGSVALLGAVLPCPFKIVVSMCDLVYTVPLLGSHQTHESLNPRTHEKKDRKFSCIQSGLLWCDCRLLKRIDNRIEAAAVQGKIPSQYFRNPWQKGVFSKRDIFKEAMVK